MYAKLLVMILVLIALAAPAVFAEEINPVLGKVGDFTVRETDLDRLIASQSPQVQKQLQEKPELKTNFVRTLLLNRAVATHARKEGYDRKPEFREKLSYLIDDYLANEYLNNVVVTDSKIPEEELQKYFKEHEKDFFVSETVKARHIFIQIPAKANEQDKAQARAKAEAVLVRLNKGEDFAKVAAEVSEDDDTAKMGGELGTIALGKTNSEEFEKAALALKTGEISAIVETPFGFHIIKADEKRAARTVTFVEARSYIESILKKELARKKSDEFLAKIVQESRLEVFGDKSAPPGSGEAEKKPEK